MTADSPENSRVTKRWFADEPFYHFYTEAVLEVSYSRCEACTTLDCVMLAVRYSAFSDITHAVCCFMSVTADGYMVSYLTEWRSKAGDSMNDFISVW